jgi:hypothetical protein
MPQFELVSLQGALSKTARPSNRTEIIQEYVGYIGRLKSGKAGRMQAGEGETLGAIRRRLGEAARLSGAEMVIKRVDDEIYFWKRPRGRRGRPRKAAIAGG